MELVYDNDEGPIRREVYLEISDWMVWSLFLTKVSVRLARGGFSTATLVGVVRNVICT